MFARINLLKYSDASLFAGGGRGGLGKSVSRPAGLFFVSDGVRVEPTVSQLPPPYPESTEIDDGKGSSSFRNQHSFAGNYAAAARCPCHVETAWAAWQSHSLINVARPAEPTFWDTHVPLRLLIPRTPSLSTSLIALPGLDSIAAKRISDSGTRIDLQGFREGALVLPFQFLNRSRPAQLE